MAKAPIPGQTKSRLARGIGVPDATNIAHQMLCQALSHALAAADSVSPPALVELHGTPDLEHPAWPIDIRHPQLKTFQQCGVGLGERMWHALQSHPTSTLPSTAVGVESSLAGPATLMGTDCPGLTGATLASHQRRLSEADAVITPAADGGYVAFSMKRFHPDVFCDIDWSTSKVFAQTLAKLDRLQCKVAIEPTLVDVDTKEDLATYPHLLSSLSSQPS